MYARIKWAFIEDVYNHRLHRHIYKYTIRRTIEYHRPWLDNNKKLFPPKFLNYIYNYKIK